MTKFYCDECERGIATLPPSVKYFPEVAIYGRKVGAIEEGPAMFCSISCAKEWMDTHGRP